LHIHGTRYFNFHAAFRFGLSILHSL
jgi:hypothetical protein